MFKFLGAGVLGYVAWAAWCGEVSGKSGFGWAIWTRDESPRRYWSVLVCYTLLGTALLTVF